MACTQARIKLPDSGDGPHGYSMCCVTSHAAVLLQVKQEMQQGSKRQLALPHTEQEGSDVVEAVLDTKVSVLIVSLKQERPGIPCACARDIPLSASVTVGELGATALQPSNRLKCSACSPFLCDSSIMVCAGYDMGGQREGAAHALCQSAEAKAGANTGACSQALL